MTSQSLSLLLSPDAWKMMREQAIDLFRSGFLPVAIDKPEKAIAIILKGYEIGLPPMQAFSSINVIQGKPTLSAEGMMALIYRHCPGAYIHFGTLNDQECILIAARPGGGKTHFAYTKKDAEVAGLWGKGGWLKHPRAMLRSRCVSEMARTLFPDALMGCSYTPDEIDPNSEIDNAEYAMVAEIKAPETPKIESPKHFHMDDTILGAKLVKALESQSIDAELHYDIASFLDGKEFTQTNISQAISVIKEQRS